MSYLSLGSFWYQNLCTVLSNPTFLFSNFAGVKNSLISSRMERGGIQSVFRFLGWIRIRIKQIHCIQQFSPKRLPKAIFPLSFFKFVGFPFLLFLFYFNSPPQGYKIWCCSRKEQGSLFYFLPPLPRE